MKLVGGVLSSEAASMKQLGGFWGHALLENVKMWRPRNDISSIFPLWIKLTFSFCTCLCVSEMYFYSINYFLFNVDFLGGALFSSILL